MIANYVDWMNNLLSFDKKQKDPESSLSIRERNEQLIFNDNIPPLKKGLDIRVDNGRMNFRLMEEKYMSKLTWHGTGERKFEAGVRDVALFVMDDGAYGPGVAWNGVTAINENPTGADATDLYADDEKYAILRSAERFGFTIEAYTFPDEWYECDGSAMAENGVYFGQQARKAFGLVYKTRIGDDTDPSMDKYFKLHLIYNSTASPSGRSYATINENPDAITMSWEANSTPEKVAGTNYKSVCTITIDSSKADATKLAALLDTIYGSDNKEPSMPSPKAVIEAFQ